MCIYSVYILAEINICSHFWYCYYKTGWVPKSCITNRFFLDIHVLVMHDFINTLLTYVLFNICVLIPQELKLKYTDFYISDVFITKRVESENVVLPNGFLICMYVLSAISLPPFWNKYCFTFVYWFLVNYSWDKHIFTFPIFFITKRVECQKLYYKRRKESWPNRDLNSQPLDWQPASLPTELLGLDPEKWYYKRDLDIHVCFTRDFINTLQK